jgi:hypothetical protein
MRGEKGRTRKTLKYIEAFHAEYARTPAFFVLGPRDNILIPSFEDTASPPFAKGADVPRIGDHETEVVVPQG